MSGAGSLEILFLSGPFAVARDEYGQYIFIVLVLGRMVYVAWLPFWQWRYLSTCFEGPGAIREELERDGRMGGVYLFFCIVLWERVPDDGS